MTRSSCRWPWDTPDRRSSMIPSLNVMTSETTALTGTWVRSSPYSSNALRNASVSTGSPLRVDRRHPLAHLGVVPGHRLELEPDLGVAGRQVLIEESHRGAPLLDERHVGRVHLLLALDEPTRESLQHPEEQLLHRAEVVVNEAMVGAGFLGEAPHAHPCVSRAHEQALGCVEKRLLGLSSRRRNRHEVPPSSGLVV